MCLWAAEHLKKKKTTTGIKIGAVWSSPPRADEVEAVDVKELADFERD